MVLGALVAAPLVAGLVVASVAGPVAAGPVASGAVAGSVSFATVTVGPGESLWSIAERIAPQDDPRDVIGELERFNGLEDSAVTPGQTLAIPAHFTS
jgi:hypothetical protein